MNQTIAPLIFIGQFSAFLYPLAALAADEQPLSAAAGLTTDNFTLILKIGIPSGLISALLTLIGVFLTNRTAQKNNREKIAAETENISRQLKQRQHEFEIQTKMQFESLHSDEKKKVCWDFLASVNPSLFPNKQFNLEKMNSCIQPLYLYCKDEYFSYFKNLTQFIMANNLLNWGARYENICKELSMLERQHKADEFLFQALQPDTSPIAYDPSSYSKAIEPLIAKKKPLDDIFKSYTHHYDLAVEAAKKLIWNEPIEKAQPLQLEDLPDEDDI